jgi:hypothetical protein
LQGESAKCGMLAISEPMRIVIVIALLPLLLAGCGTGNAPTGGKLAKPPTYRQQVTGCLDEVLLQHRKAGNALRVETPGGEQVANVLVFPTPRAAREYASRLLVAGVPGGRSVAVWLGANDDQKAVVRDCLTP